MTLWEYLHVVLDIVEHLGPVVPLLDGFMSDGLASYMVLTITIVNILDHFLGFVWSETS